jgi:uncharacterized phiE125 gp8 family phage protein
VAEAKAHLRVDSSDDDDLIESMIYTATDYVQTRTRRQLLAQTNSLYLDAFPPEITLMPSPLSQATASPPVIQYYDTGGTQQTLSSDEYTVDDKQEPAKVVPAYGKAWPATYSIPNAVVVRYDTGYVDATGGITVPNALKQAVLMHVAAQYEARGDSENKPDLSTVNAICKLYEVPYVA